MKRVLSVLLALIWMVGIIPPLSASAAGEFVIENGVLKKYKGTSANVSIPEGVVEIGDGVFPYLTPITQIYLPSTLVKIDNEYKNVFLQLQNLRRIEVSPDNPAYCSDNGVLFTKDMKEIVAFPQSHSKTTYSIPDGVNIVQTGAFEFCRNLTKVVLPDGLTYIGRSAFEWAWHMSDVVIPESVTTIGAGAFKECLAFTYNGPPVKTTPLKKCVNKKPGRHQ